MTISTVAAKADDQILANQITTVNTDVTSKRRGTMMTVSTLNNIEAKTAKTTHRGTHVRSKSNAIGVAAEVLISALVSLQKEKTPFAK